jgi:uncharacterized protein YwbE
MNMKIVTMCLMLLVAAAPVSAAMDTAVTATAPGAEPVEKLGLNRTPLRPVVKDDIERIVVRDDIRQFSRGTITRDDVRQRIVREYRAGTLTRDDLRKVLTKSYAHGDLKRDDLRWLIGNMYKAGELRRDDVRWLITQGYKNGELTRDDIRELITTSYKNGELTRNDMRWLLVQSYKAGELRRDDIREIIAKGYKHKELTREDMKWLITQAYRAGELDRDDIREILTKSYARGELKREDVKWLLMQAHKEGVLTRGDLRELLTAAYNQGELTRKDIKWLLIQAYKSGDLTRRDIVELLTAAYKNGELTEKDIKWLLRNAKEQGELDDAEAIGKRILAAKVSKRGPVVRFDPKRPLFKGANTTRAEVLYKFALIPMERHRIGMEAIIGYVDEIGGDSSALVELKADFEAQMEELKAASEEGDRDEAKQILDSMKDTVKGFRAEAKAQIGEENFEEAKARLDEALEENQEYFESLRLDAREARKERAIEIFDILVARAEEKISKLEEMGIDVTDLTAKLEEIGEKRSDFIEAGNTAIETGDRTEYDAMRTEIKEEFKELARLFKQHGGALRAANVIDAAYKRIEAVQERLDELEQTGKDVTVEKAKLEEIRTMVDSAAEKLGAGDVDGAAQDLKAAREAFTSAMKEYKRNKKIVVRGTGRLEAEGTGFAFIKGSADFIEISGQGVLVVKDHSGDMTIEVSGFGEKKETGEKEYRYAGEGSAYITGSDVAVSLRGTDIQLAAEGTGSATLRGKGTYSIGDKDGKWPVVSMEIEMGGEGQ